MTDHYAVFGNPIGHSRSPRIHALFAAQLGEDLDYVAILAPKDGFGEAMAAFVARGGRGANVTVPFKEAAFRLATERSPRAEAAGAVNTLSFGGGVVYGDNTDGSGLVRDIAGNLGFPLRGRRVLLLGAGGAARGALLPLLLEGPAELFIANRTAGKALQLADDCRRLPSCVTTVALQAGGFGDLAGRSFDLVVNATSAGLADSALPLPGGIFAAGSLAYDMVYGRDTPFLAQARAAGARAVDGLGMLVEQAAEAFELWRGRRPDTAPVLATLRKELASA